MARSPHYSNDRSHVTMSQRRSSTEASSPSTASTVALPKDFNDNMGQRSKTSTNSFEYKNNNDSGGGFRKQHMSSCKRATRSMTLSRSPSSTLRRDTDGISYRQIVLRQREPSEDPPSPVHCPSVSPEHSSRDKLHGNTESPSCYTTAADRQFSAKSDRSLLRATHRQDKSRVCVPKSILKNNSSRRRGTSITESPKDGFLSKVSLRLPSDSSTPMDSSYMIGRSAFIHAPNRPPPPSLLAKDDDDDSFLLSPRHSRKSVNHIRTREIQQSQTEAHLSEHEILSRCSYKLGSVLCGPSSPQECTKRVTFQFS